MKLADNDDLGGGVIEVGGALDVEDLGCGRVWGRLRPCLSGPAAFSIGSSLLVERLGRGLIEVVENVLEPRFCDDFSASAA